MLELLYLKKALYMQDEIVKSWENSLIHPEPSGRCCDFPPSLMWRRRRRRLDRLSGTLADVRGQQWRCEIVRVGKLLPSERVGQLM